MILMLLSGAWGKVIHEKNLKKKSRDTVPLSPKAGKQIFLLVRKWQILQQSQIRKFLRCTSPQIANWQICNDLSANRNSANFLGVPVRNSQIRKFAKKIVFLIQIRIGLPLILFDSYISIYWTTICHVTLSQNCPKSRP